MPAQPEWWQRSQPRPQTTPGTGGGRRTPTTRKRSNAPAASPFGNQAGGNTPAWLTTNTPSAPAIQAPITPRPPVSFGNNQGGPLPPAFAPTYIPTGFGNNQGGNIPWTPMGPAVPPGTPAPANTPSITRRTAANTPSYMNPNNWGGTPSYQNPNNWGGTPDYQNPDNWGTPSYNDPANWTTVVTPPPVLGPPEPPVVPGVVGSHPVQTGVAGTRWMTPSTQTAPPTTGFGTNYGGNWKKRRGGGGGGGGSYASDYVPTWYLNLNNWNYGE